MSEVQKSNLQIELEIESKPESQNNTISTKVTKEDKSGQRELKYYYPRENGTDRRVVRKYKVVNSKCYKIKENKEIVEEYVKKHKNKYMNIPIVKQARTLKTDVKNDLDIDISNGAVLKLLRAFCERPPTTIIKPKKKIIPSD